VVGPGLNFGEGTERVKGQKVHTFATKLSVKQCKTKGNCGDWGGGGKCPFWPPPGSATDIPTHIVRYMRATTGVRWSYSCGKLRNCEVLSQPCRYQIMLKWRESQK